MLIFGEVYKRSGNVQTTHTNAENDNSLSSFALITAFI